MRRRSQRLFLEILNEDVEKIGRAAEARLFQAGWMLTFLSLHALAGNQAAGPDMRRIRTEDYSLSALWKQYQKEKNRKGEGVHFLTRENSVLCSTPLQFMHFFGREIEIFELRELVAQGGHLLLSGMGGIGKTELLRQLLCLCIEQGLVDEVAVIQYEGSLVNSCANSFANLYAEDSNSILAEALARIRMQEKRRVLTLIDNMNNTLEEDPDLKQLLTLPGTVILTSRLTELEGFTTYKLRMPNKEMGMLIFRDNYEKALSKEDKENLNELLEEETWRHTLTLQLLGNTAKNKNWSVSQLRKKLSAYENREVNLIPMYRTLYDLTELSESQVKLLRCLAILPYQTYTREFVMRYLSGYLAKGEKMEEQLTRLSNCGWLSAAEQGYSLHPVIAECVLSKPAREADVEPLCEAIEAHFWELCGIDGAREDLLPWYLYSFGAEKGELIWSSLQFGFLERLQGSFSEQLVRRIIMSGILNYANVCLTKEKSLMICELRARCGELPQDLSLWLDILTIEFEYVKRKEYFDQLWDMRKKLEVPEWQIQVYGQAIAQAFMMTGELERCQAILEELLAEDIVPYVRIVAEDSYALSCMLQMRLGEAEKHQDKAIALVKKHGFPNGTLLQQLYQIKYTVCAEMRRIEEAKQILTILEELVEETQSISGQYAVCVAKGLAARNLGNLDEACRYQRETVRLCRNLLGETHEYAVNCGDLALILSMQGKMEEAESYYLKALPILNASKILEEQTSRIYNNMGDMYIKWDKPQRALECLKNAEKYGKNVQGIGRAELHRNYARAYGLSGNQKMEQEHLKTAVPLLEEVYGTEHERTVAARERLNQVEGYII